MPPRPVGCPQGGTLQPVELDDFAKGAIASLLTDQVEAKAGLAYKVAGAAGALALIGGVFLDGWLRWLLVLVLLIALALLAFAFITKRLAMGIINRIHPPMDLTNARQHFGHAIEEADIPTGPAGFMRLIWRLRKGVGPEIERLGAVVTQLRGELG